MAVYKTKDLRSKDLRLKEFTSSKHPVRRWRRMQEWFIELFLLLCAGSSILITLGIVGILVSESLPFFVQVPIKDFLFDTEWMPLFSPPRFGILPLLCGTLMTTFIALTLAIPLGTVIAAYLAEFVSSRSRELLKPLLELLAAVPTVVYGYFALLFVPPLLQKIMPQMSGFNVLSAGLVMGLMIIPYVASLSEDAMRSVPDHLREASFAMGASRVQTVFHVVIPSAFSGMTSAYVLAISRALGETMVVAIAAGMQPQISFNPLEPAETITAFIVQVSMGDLPHGTIGYQSIYVAGTVLLMLTMFINTCALYLRKKFQEKES